MLYVNDIGIFDELIEFVHLCFLHGLNLTLEPVEEPNELLPDLRAQVEILALDERKLLRLHYVIEPQVYVLKETLRSGFQQEDLGVVVLVVRQVTTLLTHQLFMQHTVSYVVLVVVGAGVWGFLWVLRTLGF